MSKFGVYLWVSEVYLKELDMRKIKYIDINDDTIKKAEYFDFDPTMNHTRLRDNDGNLFVVAAWQLDLSNAK